MDSARRLREEFSKICFETLLKYSFINESSSSNDNAVITRLALSSMLSRCKEILQKYAHDERLHGKCPLPRYGKSSLSNDLIRECRERWMNELKTKPTNN